MNELALLRFWWGFSEVAPQVVCVCFAIAIPVYRSLHTPEPRNPQKSQKGLPGPPGPECQKSVEKSPDIEFHTFWTLFRVLRDFFDTFLTLPAGRPEVALQVVCLLKSPCATHSEAAFLANFWEVFWRKFKGQHVGATGLRASEREICL